MAERIVRTQAGVEHFDVPVGSQIIPPTDQRAPNSSVSLIRLRSLYRMVNKLRSLGSTSALSVAEKEFNTVFAAALPRLSPAQVQLVMGIGNGDD